jgi:hypothetical protein
MYPKRPDLQFFIRMAVEDLLHLFPNAEPVLSSQLIEQRFNDNPLLLNPGIISERIKTQIQSLVKKSKTGKLLAATICFVLPSSSNYPAISLLSSSLLLLS